MKAVILAGGLGTRISEESHLKPKPMIEIGGKPILWHIMKIYSHYGINDFIICLGYKGYVVKEYFANYFLHMSNVTFDLVNNKMEVHDHTTEPWRVTLVDTGETTMTGGRLKRVAHHLDNEDFCFTYGDGVSNINIAQLIDFHKKNGMPATVTAVQPPGRFGVLSMEGKLITGFEEKPEGNSNWLNGGYFVLSPKVLEHIDGDDTTWERTPMEALAKGGELGAYVHKGFWQCMDTLRDKQHLEELWSTGRAPWKVW